MSTTNVSLTSPSIAYGGPNTIGSGLVGRNYVDLFSGSTLDLQVSGTDLFSINVLQDSTSGTYYSIDGGSETAPTIVGSDSLWQPLVVTLPDSGPHRITLKNRTSNSYLDSTNGITLTAAIGTPSASRPAEFSSLFTLTPGGSAYIQDEGGWDAYPFGPNAGCLFGQWRFLSLRQRCSGILRIWDFLDGGSYLIRINGVDGAPTTLPNEGRANWASVYTPGDLVEREVIIVFLTAGRAVYGVAANSINVSGTFARRTVMGAYGDSITDATGVSSPEKCYSYKAASALNFALCNRGIGFTTMAVAANNGTGLFDQVVTTKAGDNRTTNIPGTSHPRAWDLTRENPVKVVINYGSNDMADNWFAANAANGHETPSDLLSAYSDLLGYAVGGAIPALSKLVCLGLAPRSDVDDPTRAPWNASISGAVTATADARVVFQSSESLPQGTIHPGDAAHALWAAMLISQFSPANSGPGALSGLSGISALAA